MHSNNSFQAESTRSGNDFEDLVLQDLKNRGFTIISRNVYFEEIGCEFDFVSQNNLRLDFLSWHQTHLDPT